MVRSSGDFAFRLIVSAWDYTAFLPSPRPCFPFDYAQDNGSDSPLPRAGEGLGVRALLCAIAIIKFFNIPEGACHGGIQRKTA